MRDLWTMPWIGNAEFVILGSNNFKSGWIPGWMPLQSRLSPQVTHRWPCKGKFRTVIVYCLAKLQPLQREILELNPPTTFIPSSAKNNVTWWYCRWYYWIMPVLVRFPDLSEYASYFYFFWGHHSRSKAFENICTIINTKNLQTDYMILK